MRSTLVIAAVALVAPVRPLAANMEISPVRVELAAGVPSAVITVKNGGATATRYQVSAFAWTEVAAGEAKLVPSDELAAFPPLFQLGPGEARKVRVGATVPPGAAERAWRLFIEELPSAVEDPKAGAQIKIRTRFAIPVFLAPTRPQAAGAVSLAVVDGKVKAVLRNAGNVHLRPTTITVTLLGDTGEKLHESELSPAIVLAMAERASDVEVPRDICTSVRSATVVAVLPHEKLRASLALPGGACAP